MFGKIEKNGCISMNYLCKVCNEKLWVWPRLQNPTSSDLRKYDEMDVWVYQCSCQKYTLWIRHDNVPCMEFVSFRIKNDNNHLCNKHLQFSPITKQAFIILNGERKDHIEISGFDELTSERVIEWQQRLKNYNVFT